MFLALMLVFILLIAFDHAADQQNEHQHQGQEHVLVIGEIKQEIAEMLRHLIDRKKPSHRC